MADQPWNTFIEGDNLEVLPMLEAEFGKVDLVYIDPPYNTGNEFAYRDDIRGEQGGSRHDAWVSMMRPRLEAACGLLADRGAIFVSIDDNEAAYLRLLMDEVFGEANFLAQVVVNLNPKGRQLGKGFATSHEYLMVYAKDARRTVLDASSTDTVVASDFPLVDGEGRRYRHLPLRNTNKKFNPVTARTLHFPVYGDPDSGLVRTRPFEGGHEIAPVFGDGTPAVWRWSAPLIDERGSDLVCRLIKGRNGERVDVFQKDWLHPDIPGGRRKKLRTIWLAEEVGSTDTAVAELKEIVGHVFESPEADRAGPADPVDDAGRRAGAGLLRGERYDGARGRARQRGGRRDAALRERELRGADSRGFQRPHRRPAHGRRHHPRPAAGGRGETRWRARRKTVRIGA